MVSDITTISSAVKDAQKTANTQIKLAEDFDQFLNLLTTQLQNQDPLSPMETNEFTNQIVQFSAVEQQINMNQKLDSLVQMELAGISSVALGYVGLDISYVSDDFNFDGQKPVNMSFALEGDSVDTVISIIDENGNSVYTEDGPTGPGPHDFTWDGRDAAGDLLPEGTYTVNVGAVDKDGQSIKTSTVVSGNVDGIETQDGVIFLLVGKRAVPLSTVINAKLPDENTSLTNNQNQTVQ